MSRRSYRLLPVRSHRGFRNHHLSQTLSQRLTRYCHLTLSLTIWALRHTVRRRTQGYSPIPPGLRRGRYSKSRSIARRSRLVGRPRPLSRMVTCARRRSRNRSNSLAGVSSATNSATSFAPTRERGTAMTRNVRVSNACFTTTVSPAWTARPGFAAAPFISTEFPRQASVASGRVLNTRTAHNHLSSRAGAVSESESVGKGPLVYQRTVSSFCSVGIPIAASRPAAPFRNGRDRCVRSKCPA